jgi:hypothetical protein
MPRVERIVSQKVLRIIVVYHHAKDYPEHNFVARQWFVFGGRFWAQTKLFSVGQTLREVREPIPDYMVCIPRLPGEDPAILETWV